MTFPWLRRNFLARRTLDRLLIDPPDALFRLLTGRGSQPPYSLRSFVGGTENFDEAGRFFLDDFHRLGLFRRGSRVLEIGCGCGRVARSLAGDPGLKNLEVSYDGMDVDRASIDWCSRHIAKHNPRFRFYHANCYNPSYNPAGSLAADTYRFPHENESFDLIILTSVLTHVLPHELKHYLSEVARLLAPDGVAYASFFLYRSPEEAAIGSGRHVTSFPIQHGDYAVNREDFPTNAVAYDELYVRELVHSSGLQETAPPRYGLQDILLLSRQVNTDEFFQLGDGWHASEMESWRWTKRNFVVTLFRRRGVKSTLRFRFRVAEQLLGPTGQLRLSARVSGIALPTRTYTSAGEHLYVEAIPSLIENSVSVEFQVESGKKPILEDQRELGVQVIFRTSAGATGRWLCPCYLT